MSRFCFETKPCESKDSETGGCHGACIQREMRGLYQRTQFCLSADRLGLLVDTWIPILQLAQSIGPGWVMFWEVHCETIAGGSMGYIATVEPPQHIIMGTSISPGGSGLIVKPS